MFARLTEMFGWDIFCICQLKHSPEKKHLIWKRVNIIYKKCDNLEAFCDLSKCDHVIFSVIHYLHSSFNLLCISDEQKAAETSRMDAEPESQQET